MPEDWGHEDCEVCNDARVVAAEVERDALRDELAWAKSELAFFSDRGDHVVYRDEWEAFDKWQRGEREPREEWFDDGTGQVMKGG